MNNQNQNAFQGQSQYRGMQKTFQPTGFVNSVYKQQNLNQMAGNQFTNQQSFHTTQYKGNQQGHDSYLHSDSATPFQQQQSQFGTNQNQFASNQQNQFHTANYRGNQQGHDNNLRSDSINPYQQNQQNQQNWNQNQQSQFMRK